jgi:FkbM family methyltransferase
MGLRDGVGRWLKRRLGVPSVDASLEMLAARGLRPRVVYDIGAYHGEFAQLCRRVFGPQTKVYCFEPLAEARRRLAAQEARGEITLVPGLVGAEDRDGVAFHEMETASSVLTEHHPTNAHLARHPMRRLDTFAASPGNASPDLLKIDTQGYELEVLKGAEQALTTARLVLAELNLLDIHQGVALAGEVISWLGRRGWVLYDVCSLIRRPLDRALWQADALFLKEGDPLRSDKRWGA